MHVLSESGPESECTCEVSNALIQNLRFAWFTLGLDSWMLSEEGMKISSALLKVQAVNSLVVVAGSAFPDLPLCLPANTKLIAGRALNQQTVWPYLR